MNSRALGMEILRRQAHPNCVVCSAGRESGKQLEFALLEDGCVQTTFECDKVFQGYPGLLHGGVISSLLDGAMTNCLFAHGQQGVTGELKVRFCHPVATGRVAIVRAWLDRSVPHFHVLQAELIQDGQVKARATGKFVERSHFEAAQRRNGVADAGGQPLQ
jgi:acyl-coenzyme A thioesterase PaaI-like protein